MTMNVFARAEMQEVLFEAFLLNDLEPDIKKCKINSWLAVLEYCIDKPIGYFRYFDNKIKPNMLEHLVYYAKDKLSKTPENFIIQNCNQGVMSCSKTFDFADKSDIIKMTKYLSLCLQYKATIYIE
jgi:hypothetical protein